MISYIILLAIFLSLSAFFSGMEAAVFSISRFRIKSLIFENKKGAQTLEKIKKEPHKTLAAILLSNLLVNIGAVSVATIILTQIIISYEINSTLSFIIEFIIMTSLLLIWGEITPKVIAISNAEFLALRFGGMINFISRFFNPISSFSEYLICHIIPAKKHYGISDKEIKFMLQEAKKFNILDEREEQFGYQILKFGKMKVSEIMTPKTKVVSIDACADLSSAKIIIKKTKHSRISVFNSSGEICGVLYAKDLFLRQLDLMKNRVADLMREPYIVPETKQLDNLLVEFRKKGIHFSIVVDEFGDFSGVITLEDILELLFGEITDEYDSEADLPYQKVGSDVYLFDGDVSIAEVSQIFKSPAFGEGGRLAAMVLKQLGRFPKEKEKFYVANFEITVEEIRQHTIKKILIKKL